MLATEKKKKQLQLQQHPNRRKRPKRAIETKTIVKIESTKLCREKVESE